MNNILTVNGGSSSLKCSLYRESHEELSLLYTLKVTDIVGDATLKVIDSQGLVRETNALCTNHKPSIAERHLYCLEQIILWLRQYAPDDPITVISNRVVHGGSAFSKPILIDDASLTQLEALIPLAPLHQPYNLQLINACSRLLPQMPQVACFDTMFHSTQADIATAYAIPQWLSDKGVRRYGFHGLSYEFIQQQLRKSGLLKQKAVVAHLGAGTSLCAIKNEQSVATTMGFSAAEGLPMATRTGAIDPGVILFLLQHEQKTAEEVEHIIYKESGWLGMSGLSHDMQTLLDSTDPNAQRAIDIFCYRVGREIGSLAAALQGIEQIIFTGGVGEHSAAIREKIITHCQWINAHIDHNSNQQHHEEIHSVDSAIDIRVIPTDEEFMLAKHCSDQFAKSSH